MKSSFSATMSRIAPISLIALLAVAFCGCATRTPTAAPTATSAKAPRQIIFLIGDGMGSNQVTFAKEVLSTRGPFDIAFESFPVRGLQHTRSASHAITDSAAAATAMACGVRTINGWLGMDTNRVPLQSIARIAHDRGWKVGLLTSQSIDHATPAGFYASVTNRNQYPLISRQLAETPFEIVGGGHMRGESNEDKSSNLDAMRARGYSLVDSRDGLKNLPPKARVFAVDRRRTKNGALPRVIDRKPGDLTLPEFTKAALSHLADAPFFLMVEGGQIDSACHDNDFGSMVHEVEDFNEAVKVCLDYAKSRPDVLVVVTADHETGGLRRVDPLPEGADPARALRQTRTGREALPAFKQLASEKAGAPAAVAKLEDLFGKDAFTAEQRAEIEKAWANGKDPLKFLQKAAKEFYASCGYEYTTGGHTAADIPVFAFGPGADAFRGTYDNTGIFDRFRAFVEAGR